MEFESKDNHQIEISGGGLSSLNLGMVATYRTSKSPRFTILAPTELEAGFDGFRLVKE
jgi:hypothetical protein